MRIARLRLNAMPTLRKVDLTADPIPLLLIGTAEMTELMLGCC